MFEQLAQRLDPGQRTAWLPLPMVSPGAAVELRHCGETNSGYFDAMLARAGKRARKAKEATDPAEIAQATREFLLENRAEDRDLFGIHVLVGWRNIVDDGGPVEATDANRAEFCAKMPAWIFDKIRNFAADPARFVGEVLSPADTKKLAGN